ncbi:MAG: glycosyltransferase [Bifidobacterium sp.]|nr:glycosyltransferase [Bifidobacterium sp.]
MATNPSEDGWEVVDRVVFPTSDADQTMPLYAIEWTRPVLDDDTVNPFADFYSLDFGAMNEARLRHLLNANRRPSARVDEATLTVTGRTAVTVHAGRHASFCTYFNAFPASYWRRWTAVREVRFTATAQGRGTVSLMRSSGRGLLYPVKDIDVDSPDKPVQVTVGIPMSGLMDGGFFWFDAKASRDGELAVRDASWAVPAAARPAPAKPFSIAITTFNRPSYCLRQLNAIAGDANVRARLDTIYCTDQGTDHVSDQPGFADTAKELGTQLTYLRQRNLGGSGGFSRGMLETLKAGRSDYTLLLDDDAISEPESIIRAVQFADYCTTPTIVGGGMFHLDNRTVLYAQSERLDTNEMRMFPCVGAEYNHDYAQFPLRDCPKLHKRFNADFNGWWLCLVPVAVMREIGLSMPAFIKFDDIEYGVRAKEHGFPTVSLPGVAVWHQAWHDKDPGRTWEEYFNNRNRWVCALLHVDRPTPTMVYQMAYGDANLGLRLVYSGVELRHLAMRDVMRGPAYMVDSLPTQLARVREARKGFSDTEVRGSMDDFPPALAEYEDHAKPRSRQQIQRQIFRTVFDSLTHNVDGRADKRPKLAVSAKDATWRAFRGQSSVLVTSADGNSVAWCRRDNPLFRKQFMRGLKLSRELVKRWEALARQYRAADIGSVETWEAIFAKRP